MKKKNSHGLIQQQLTIKVSEIRFDLNNVTNNLTEQNDITTSNENIKRDLTLPPPDNGLNHVFH